MTASTMLNNYLEIELKKAEDANTIKNVALAIKKEFVSSYHSTVNQDEDLRDEYAKILNMTTMAVKMYANSYYKVNPYLDALDIEQIKKSLNNYANNKAKLNDFKSEIVDDLTDFQKQIRENHIKKIVDLKKQTQALEKEIINLDFEKNRLIMSRLSKIEWPYDSKTKEYDCKIAALQAKLQIYTQKAIDMEALRPAANEKDILLYQMHLKEKYAQKD